MLSFPSFFHVSGHVAKLATTLLSWPTAIALSAYQLTEVTNNVTYFVLKINVVLKQTLMFKSFNKWISVRNISVLIFAIVSSYLGIKFVILVEVCCFLCKPFILRKKAPSWKEEKERPNFSREDNEKSSKCSSKGEIIKSTERTTGMVLPTNKTMLSMQMFEWAL